MTGADLVVGALAAAGVRQLFTLSGNQVLSVYDATVGRDVRLIHTRHEAAAVHMADAWGRLTDEPGVALLTAGPGHANAVSALYAALMAESPLVLLSGHAPRRALGTGAFQEMDQVAIVRQVTKAAWLAEDAGRLGHDVSRALALARTGRPGPVHVSLPSDLLEATVPSDAAPPAPGDVGAPHPSDSELDELLTLLAEAKRPLILVGPAMGRGARWAAVNRLAETTRAPALVMESPRGVNDPALRSATGALAEADLVLLVEKRLDFSLAFGKPPAFAADCRFVELAAGALPGLVAAASAREWPDGDWHARVAEARRATPAEWDAIRRGTTAPPHPLQVCAALQPFLDAGGVLISDGGEFGQWAQGALDATIRLINGPAGGIGSALPMALAAKLAHPHRPVFATLGDGTFGYHALELDTALRYDLPVVAVIGNDARWNAEYQLQLRHYGPARAVGCELRPSRYDLVAAGLGCHGELVERPEQLEGALARAVASERPACVNVLIEGAPAPTFRPDGGRH